MTEKKTVIRPTHKTFCLEHPRDHFDKLVWELEGLKVIPRSNDRARAYQIMNAMTTAWHMIDWVYSFMTSEQRASRTNGTPGIRGYQEWLRHNCGALHVCRQIATASKHSQVTEFDDEDIGTDHLNMPAPDGQKRVRSEPKITISGAQWDPDALIHLTVDFWRDELGRLDLFVEPSPWGKATRNPTIQRRKKRT